MRKPKS